MSALEHNLEELIEQYRPLGQRGKVASYIPQLKKANPNHIAITVCTLNGVYFEAGDVDVRFTMQSISKVLTLALALMEWGEEGVFAKVGMEPTGDPFNSIYKLEMTSPSKPLNPMINAGAIAVTSLLLKDRTVDEAVKIILDFVRQLADNPSIHYNEAVFRSERETADLNRALAYFLKYHNVIDEQVESVLEVYFKQCAIEISCHDLARIGAVLANGGRDLMTQESLIPDPIAKICKTFMVTCGMYNASGKFAIRVGIPAKSGVAGGILATVPHRMGIGVYSPALDEKGNSLAGVKLLEAFAQANRLSIF